MRYWKVNCMEPRFPGLWHTWYTHQVVAVGWAKQWGYRLDGQGKQEPSWSKARAAVKRMQIGDRVIVQLSNHRVGRIGDTVKLAIDDEKWNPTVPRSPDEPDGEQGRRVLVRWDLTCGPANPDLVVALPENARLNSGQLRYAVCGLDAEVFKRLERALRDEANWVSILPQFAYEKSLSDYIAAFPHRLEDGLRPFPSTKAREYVFKDRKRADVLLLDRDENWVVVECKQSGPTVDDIRQLLGYMKRASEQTDHEVRGVLVHGGARKLPDAIRREIKKHPAVELLQYSVTVGFLPST